MDDFTWYRNWQAVHEKKERRKMEDKFSIKITAHSPIQGEASAEIICQTEEEFRDWCACLGQTLVDVYTKYHPLPEYNEQLYKMMLQAETTEGTAPTFRVWTWKPSAEKETKRGASDGEGAGTLSCV